jgi:hypothetical protein
MDTGILKWKTGSGWYRIKIKRNRTEFVMWRPTLELARQARDTFLAKYDYRDSSQSFQEFYKEWRHEEYIAQIALQRKKYSPERSIVNNISRSISKETDMYSRTWFEEHSKERLAYILAHYSQSQRS